MFHAILADDTKGAEWALGSLEASVSWLLCVPALRRVPTKLVQASVKMGSQFVWLLLTTSTNFTSRKLLL